MNNARPRTWISRIFRDYGMLSVLIALCIVFSLATWQDYYPADGGAARDTVAAALAGAEPGARVLVIVRDLPRLRAFAEYVADALRARGAVPVETVAGSPAAAREALDRHAAAGVPLAAVIADHETGNWPLFADLARQYPSLGVARVATPGSYRWPSFFTLENLRNVTDQIVIIAVLAIGMTMVIITGGIDLSVGSLIALSAVFCAMLLESAGGREAGIAILVLGMLGGILVATLAGAFSGIMVTVFSIPAFVATLAMMSIAKGAAFLLSDGQSISDVPAHIAWLDRGTLLPHLPNGVLLMILLYAGGHILMSHTVLGRNIYAVGGNREAARLSGVRVKTVLLIVYTISGALAGLGGVMIASQLQTGDPKFGQMYELKVIAAVVVGGTSLVGGEGRILGTLIGALTIAVIEIGMNLTGVHSYMQWVVFGLLVLGAALVDSHKKGSFRFLGTGRRKAAGP